MKKFNTSPISGMQELLPGPQAEFNRLKAGIAAAYHAHGFQSIETPIIDRTDVLLAKAGGDTEKQIYRVVKTTEAADGADQALRFDHTVPLARYVVEHANDLTFPFKVTQIGRNFRGERAQKGRFREFYQCDVDVVGWLTLPLAYDAEVIATLIDALRVFPLPNITVRVSNRKLLTGLLEALNLQQVAREIFSIVDHAEKVPPEKTARALSDLGLGEENTIKLLAFMNLRGPRTEVVKQLRAFGFENATYQSGIEELDTVLALLESRLNDVTPSGSRPNDVDAVGSAHSALSNITSSSTAPRVSVEADMMIVRGLDYYTGTVFETITPDYREIGSICSGGRYENLASYYTDQKLPGVGGSIGLTRLFFILSEYGLIRSSAANAKGQPAANSEDQPATSANNQSVASTNGQGATSTKDQSATATKNQPAAFPKPVDICIIPISASEYAAAEALATCLRRAGRTVDVVLTDKRLGDKMTYASRIADFAAVIGADEVSSGRYTQKNLQTGEISDI